MSTRHKNRKARSAKNSKQKKALRPRIEVLEDRTVPSSTAFWSGFGGNSQHTAVSPVSGQALNSIVWQTSIDQDPQYTSGGELLIHYGEPAVTQNNTLLVPVKTGATGNYEIEAIDGYTGQIRWTISTDYILPSSSWTPSFGPVLTPSGRVYFPGAGGTVYYFDNPDSLTAPVVHQVAFYGLSNYEANSTAYNSSVYIDTPITSDANGDIFFGFRVQGTAPAPLNSTQSGYARIDPSGNGTYALVGAMTNDSNISLDSMNAAPALSNDGSSIYVLAKSTSQYYGYLVQLNSTTLATESQVFLADPRNGAGAGILDISTASPMVAPDGTVFIGVMGNPYNGSRGFMLHFSANLSQEYTPGAFGWDDTASIVPASMVPGYTGTSSYLIFVKYNNYVAAETGNTGGNGVNEIGILDPYASQADTRNDAIPPNGSNDPSLQVMKEIMTIAGPTPDTQYTAQYPDAVHEWCINSCVVDPADDSIYANSEDGKLYRWDLATNTLAESVTLTAGLGEAYTPTFMGPDGKVYAINNAILFAVGQSWDNFGGDPQHSEISTVAAQPIDAIHWQASVDLNTQSDIPTHYGEPVFTPNNTVIVPVKTGASGGFELQAYNGATGTLLWTVTTDYQEPPYSWLPPFQPVYSALYNRVYFAGNGGTIYYIDNPDSPGATISGQIAFYGTSNYDANPAAYNSTVQIDSPLTVDNDGNVYFGFMVTGTNPSGLTGGGVGRVSATGAGTYALASAAIGGNDSNITREALGSAPVLSLDGSIVYAALNGTGFNGENDAYLVGLNSTTLATVYKTGPLLDPRSSSLNDGVIDESTAAPMVAPDGTVFFGTFGNLNNYNGSRGFLLHFSANLTQEFTPGAFGWDDTVSIIPASMVPSYTGTSSYLVLAKYNNYVAGETGSSGGNGVNEIAILDPYATEPDPNNDSIPPTGTADSSLLVMKQIMTITSPTPDPDWITNGYPDAVNEWCTNGTAVDPFTDSVFINNEDGYAYRWSLATGTLTQAIQISPGISEPYTATAIGPDGTVYAINGGTLFALGAETNYSINNVSSQYTTQYGQSITFTTTLASTDNGATPTGTITYKDGSTVLGTGTLVNGVASFTTSALTVLHHHITAAYSGDGNYAAGQTTLVQTVLDESTTNLSSSTNPSEFGQSVTLTATVAPVVTTNFVPIGSVTFMDGTTVLGTVALNSSDQATLNTSALTGGTHSITAVYSGDLNFATSTSTAVQQAVTQDDTYTNITSSVNPSTLGQSVTFTAAVSSDPPLQVGPTGDVTFMDGTTVLATIALTNGTASYTTTSLTVGGHSITAVYDSDENYSGSTSPLLTQTVNKGGTTSAVVASVDPSVYGQNVVFTATVTPNASGFGAPTGTVTFLDGTTVLGSGTLSGGTTTFNTSSLSVGGHSITVQYSGDSNFTSSTSSALTQTVNQAGSSSVVVSGTNPSVYGQSVTFTATVSASSPGAGTPTGTVSFLDGTTVLATKSLSGGSAAYSTSSLSVGSHSITVSYGGDGNFTGSTSSAVSQTVNQDSSSSVVVSGTNPSVYGQSVTFTATVSANSPGAGTATGTVSFLDGTTVLATKSLSGGSATFSTSSLSVGSHSITVSYGGDGNFTGSTSSAVSQNVNQDGSSTSVVSSSNPSVYGQSVTFTATVSASSPGSGTPTGTVTFLDGTTVLDATSLSGGSATFTTSSLALGGHSITVSYGGDGNFTSSTSSALTQTVNQAGSSSVVVSGTNPSVYGQSVTFTATVSASSPGAGTPTGTVSFLDGTTVLGTGTLSGGVATYSTSSLSVGSHSITVSYGGDGNFTGSTSSAVSQNVNQDSSSSSVVSSANPSVYGQSVTFTATVSANSPGAGTPTGTVSFLDGTTVLGTGTLSGGVATYVTSSLSVGSHSITVSYGGDGNFTGSTSSAVSQTVNQDGTTSSVTSSDNPSASGELVTFTATVAANAPGSGTPTGSVTFFDGTTTLGTVSLSAGSASYSTSSLALGSHSITVQYLGDSNFTTSTSSVLTQVVNSSVTGTTTSITSSANPSLYDQRVSFTIVVRPTSGTNKPTGTVTVYDGTTELGTATLSNGSASYMTTSLSVGSHSITATYGGDANDTGSTSPVLTQVVNVDPTTSSVVASPNPTVFGENVTFTATIAATAPGSGTPTGNVTFYDGTTVLATEALSSGRATLTTSALSVANHSISVSYSTDGNYGSSTSPTITQTVNQDASSAKVTTSGTPSAYGQAVTFTATISASSPGSGTPTGSVTFLDGTTVLGTGTLSGGVASYVASSLAIGNHSITVSYAGDTNFTGSTSPVLTQTVSLASTAVSLSSSSNPVAQGHSVTFTAKVTVKSPGSGIPTGTVTFKNGTAVIGTSNLNAEGIATIAEGFSRVGTYSITAIYNGDSNFATSTSPIYTEYVTSGVGPFIVLQNGKPSFSTASILKTIGQISPTAAEVALAQFNVVPLTLTRDNSTSGSGSATATMDKVFAGLGGGKSGTGSNDLEDDGI